MLGRKVVAFAVIPFVLVLLLFFVQGVVDGLLCAFYNTRRCARGGLATTIRFWLICRRWFVDRHFINPNTILCRVGIVGLLGFPVHNIF